MYHYTCLICQKQFSSKIKSKKYCSRECQWRSLGDPKERRPCITCHKEFFYRKSNVEKGKQRRYCSQACRYIYENTAEHKLLVFKNHYEKNVIKNENGCWGWKGHVSKQGYGKTFYKKAISINRASWIIHFGEIPEGILVCHYCDNPICSRPNHLFLGNHLQNIHDMMEKGRKKKILGSQVGTSRLKEDEIVEIKKMLKLGIKQKEIAQQFGVNKGTISAINMKKSWSHIIID